MTVTHLKTDPSKTMLWSSGTTSEIYIYPTSANLGAQDFLFRISIATVEAEATTFTKLPGVTRTLMVMNGNLTLTHEGNHITAMTPFDQDTFQGDWETKSTGLATNFNLMCQHGASGSMNHIQASIGSEIVIQRYAKVELIYLQSGTANYNGQPFEAGDCLVVANGANDQVSIHCEEKCDFVRSSVDFADSND